MKLNYEFQAILSFATGLFLGFLSSGIVITLIFIVLFELFVVFQGLKYPPIETLERRLSLNLIFILGWIISRIIFLRETGFEYCTQVCSECFK